jgi:hypothetical protein
MAEEEIIDEVYRKFRHMTNAELIEYVHELPEWENPHGKSIKIPYERVLELNGFSCEEIRSISEDLNDQDSLRRLIETAA